MSNVLQFKQPQVKGTQPAAQKRQRYSCVTCGADKFYVSVDREIFCCGCDGYIWHLKVEDMR